MQKGDEEYKIDGWTLDKRISVGHIITTLALILSFVTWMIRMENQVAVVRHLTVANADRIDRLEADQTDHYTEIIRRMERVEALLIQHMSKVQGGRNGEPDSG